MSTSRRTQRLLAVVGLLAVAASATSAVAAVSSQTELVSARDGEAADWSVTPELSADGRTVTFSSDAENLAAEDQTLAADLVVRVLP